MSDTNMSLGKKSELLTARLMELGCASVAFSGGTDSALLAYCASAALAEKACVMTIWSPLLSRRDREDILAFTEKYNIRLIRVDFDETADKEFRENKADRCYRCKSLRLEALEAAARGAGIPWVLDGSNVSDLSDYRPGMRALEESETTLSPLLECGFTKKDVRSLSRMYGLPTAEKPAAACLASRIPTNVHLEKDLLCVVDQGEELIRARLPLNAQVRLRFDGKAAKIETDRENMPGLSAVFDTIRDELTTLGIDREYISCQDYRMGGAMTQQ